MGQKLEDTFNRQFNYLRLSITDVCNFKCNYCLPDGYQADHRKKAGFLTLNEIDRLVQAFAMCGTKKIRITGGEPTLRKDFLAIVETIARHTEIEKIALTTNGYRMEKQVGLWKSAGLTHLNVSVDSLNPELFYEITGQNRFHQVMRGIEAAFAAGFAQVKVNCVLMKGFNAMQLPAFLNWIKDKPIQLRFIELMQTGQMDKFFDRHHVSGSLIKNELIAQGWQLASRSASDGPAQVFRHSAYLGEIGLIMPYEASFCEQCNRLRVSSLGKLHLCLFGEHGIELRDLLQQSSQQHALIERINTSLLDKKQTHFLHDGLTGMTENLSSIGG